MNNFKKILLSFTSILLIGAINLPSFVKLSHALFEHTEQTCEEQGSLHIHEAELDCDFQKFNLSSQFYPQLQDYTLHPPRIIKKENNNHYFFLSNYQKLHFSLRGPPSIS